MSETRAETMAVSLLSLSLRLPSPSPAVALVFLPTLHISLLPRACSLGSPARAPLDRLPCSRSTRRVTSAGLTAAAVSSMSDKADTAAKAAGDPALEAAATAAVHAFLLRARFRSDHAGFAAAAPSRDVAAELRAMQTIAQREYTRAEQATKDKQRIQHDMQQQIQQLQMELQEAREQLREYHALEAAVHSLSQRRSKRAAALSAAEAAADSHDSAAAGAPEDSASASTLAAVALAQRAHEKTKHAQQAKPETPAADAADADAASASQPSSMPVELDETGSVIIQAPAHKRAATAAAAASAATSTAPSISLQLVMQFLQLRNVCKATRVCRA